METLGIIAGGGEAPKRLVAACKRTGRPYHVLAFIGQAAGDVEADATRIDYIHLGAAEEARRICRERNLREIVMIGCVRRPSLAELRPDALMMGKLAKIGFHLLGDDGLLKAVVREIEAEGFRVIAAQDVFAGLLTPEGQLGAIALPEERKADLARGIDVARRLGELDVGQAVVVQQGIVLAVEGAEGTEALLRRAGDLRREGPGGVLVKLKKPRQDPRFDLPALGPDTVRQAAAAGLAGIAAEAGASLFIDREEALRLADAAGLFVLGITDSPFPEGLVKGS